MLNIENEEPEVVLKSLWKYLYLNRISITIFVIQMVIQGAMAAFFILIQRDMLDERLTKIFSIALIANNLLIFIFLSYMVIFFLSMGFFFARYVSVSDDPKELAAKIRRAKMMFTGVSLILLLSYFYNYIINSTPLLLQVFQIYDIKFPWLSTGEFSRAVLVVGIIESLMPLILGLSIMVVIKYFGDEALSNQRAESKSQGIENLNTMSQSDND